MKRLKILVISLILIMSFNYFAPIVYAVENNTKDEESSNKKDENKVDTNKTVSKEESAQKESEEIQKKDDFPSRYFHPRRQIRIQNITFTCNYIFQKTFSKKASGSLNGMSTRI